MVPCCTLSAERRAHWFLSPLPTTFMPAYYARFSSLLVSLLVGLSSLNLVQAISGTANNTIFIIAVDTSIARSLLPQQYNLLPVNKTLLPNFPHGKFPLIAAGGQDININDAGGLVFAQGHLQIPFVDRLGDGKTPFLFTPSLLIDNPIAAAGTTVGIGAPAYLANITPGQGTGTALAVAANGRTLTFSATEVVGDGYLNISAVKVAASSLPWPISSYFTISNFPGFGPNTAECYTHVEYDPVGVLTLLGSVSVSSPPLSQSASFTKVYGVSATKYFTESLGLSCSTLAA